MAALYLCIAFTLNALANILLKVSSFKGLKIAGLSPGQIIAQNSLFLLGLFVFASNVIFYFLALRSMPLSVAYPIMVGMSFIIINAYSYFVLAEKITAMQIVGYIFIVVGIVLTFAFARS